MATLLQRSGKTPGYEIQFYRNDKRITIYLGGRKYSRKTADQLKEIVEALIYYQDNGTLVPDKRISGWIESASDEIQSKLAKAGLIEKPERRTLKELWDTFLAYKTQHVKESTMKVYTAVRRRFFLFFKAGDILDELTREQMQAWKNYLLDEIETATVANYIKTAKVVFNWAKAQGWITESPLTGIGTGSFVNKKNDRIVPMSDYYKLLDAAPCKDWRCIIALTRIGGLRCPSELLQLRWEDIDWERGYFLVRSPKTEHHEGREGRTVPIFPELKTELESLFFDPASEGKEFVVNRYRDASQNLRTTLEKIFNRAKLPMIPRPFDNFRMTRSNEVYNRWGSFKESQWIGHSSRVRADHCLMLTDDDYLAAAQWESRAASDKPKANRPKALTTNADILQ